jgi:hypothetical protein
MEYRIPCEIIKDLLPLYVDELTSEYTNKEVDNHLKECRECREEYNCIITTLDFDIQNKSKGEIDYLKKININQKRKLIMGSIISFLLGLVIPILSYTPVALKALLSGGKLPAYQIDRLKNEIFWYNTATKMLISGFILFALYLIFKFIYRKLKTK